MLTAEQKRKKLKSDGDQSDVESSVAIFGRLRPNWSFSESSGRKIFYLVALVVLVVFGIFWSFWSFWDFLAISIKLISITLFSCVLTNFQCT